MNLFEWPQAEVERCNEVVLNDAVERLSERLARAREHGCQEFVALDSAWFLSAFELGGFEPGLSRYELLKQILIATTQTDRVRRTVDRARMLGVGSRLLIDVRTDTEFDADPQFDLFTLTVGESEIVGVRGRYKLMVSTKSVPQPTGPA